MPETSSHKLWYPEAGSVADVPTDLKKLAEGVDKELDAINPKQVTGGAKANIIIATSGGVGAYKAMKGDATIAEDGTLTVAEKAIGTSKLAEKAVTTARLDEKSVTEAKLGTDSVTAAKIAENAVGASEIAPEAVGTSEIAENGVGTSEIASSAVAEAELADGAVTSRKAKLTCGEKRASGGITLTEAAQDVPGTELKITPAVASVLMVTTIFDFNYVAACQTYGWLNVDGKNQANFAGGFQPTTTAETCPQVYAIALTAAAHTIKLQAQRDKGSALLESGITGYTYVLIAS